MSTGDELHNLKKLNSKRNSVCMIFAPRNKIYLTKYFRYDNYHYSNGNYRYSIIEKRTNSDLITFIFAQYNSLQRNSTKILLTYAYHIQKKIIYENEEEFYNFEYTL